MYYQQERTYGCRISDAWTYRGLKTAVIENELLRVVVLLDKGASIYQLVHKPTDVDFMWRSPAGVRDPSKFVPTSGSPAGLWLDFCEGGWQTVVPGGGRASTYGGAELGMHAEVTMVPWDAVVLDDEVEKVSMRCRVRCARTPIFVEKTLSLTRNRAVLDIEETVVNESVERFPVVWGQHVTLGAPFLGEDCVIDVPGGILVNYPRENHANNRLKPGRQGPWPWSEGKSGGRIDLSRVPPPTIRALDRSYLTEMPDGWYAVTNQKLEVGFAFRWPVEVFRYLWYWQSLGGGTGYPWYGRTYNVGLQPFTSYPNDGLQASVDNQTALWLEPGQRVTVTMKAVAYSGVRGVKDVRRDGTIVART